MRKRRILLATGNSETCAKRLLTMYPCARVCVFLNWVSEGAYFCFHHITLQANMKSDGSFADYRPSRSCCF